MNKNKMKRQRPSQAGNTLSLFHNSDQEDDINTSRGIDPPRSAPVPAAKPTAASYVPLSTTTAQRSTQLSSNPSPSRGSTGGAGAPAVFGSDFFMLKNKRSAPGLAVTSDESSHDIDHENDEGGGGGGGGRDPPQGQQRQALFRTNYRSSKNSKSKEIKKKVNNTYAADMSQDDASDSDTNAQAHVQGQAMALTQTSDAADQPVPHAGLPRIAATTNDNPHADSNQWLPNPPNKSALSKKEKKNAKKQLKQQNRIAKKRQKKLKREKQKGMKEKFMKASEEAGNLSPPSSRSRSIDNDQQDLDEDVGANEEDSRPLKTKLKGPTRYFLVDSTICKKCGLQGHLEFACEEEDPQARCHLCGLTDHVARDCPSKVCFACGAMGHLSKTCPVRVNSLHAPRGTKVNLEFESKPIPIACYNCGSYSHLDCSLIIKSSDNNNNNKNKARTSCFNCGRSGHRGSECDQPNTDKVMPIAMRLVREMEDDQQDMSKQELRLYRSALREDSSYLDEMTQQFCDRLQRMVRGGSHQQRYRGPPEHLKSRLGSSRDTEGQNQRYNGRRRSTG